MKAPNSRRARAAIAGLTCLLLLNVVPYQNATAGELATPVVIDDTICTGPLAGQLCTAWSARYDGPMSGNDIAYGIAIAPDGSRIYVTGHAEIVADSTAGYATIAYDSVTGREVWIAHYEPAENGQQYNGLNIAYAIDVSPDGSQVFVTGKSRSDLSNADQHYDTIAYDADDGTEQWVTRYDGPGSGHDIPHALSVSPDGSTVFVTGQSAGIDTLDDYATVAYGAAHGTELWVTRYDGPLSAHDRAFALDLSPDGSTVYVTGQSPSPDSGLDYATIAYDAYDGSMRWTTRYNGAANGVDIAADLQAAADGNSVLVTGHSQGVGTGIDFVTIRYQASDGSLTWVARYNGEANGGDVAVALDQSSDGARVYVIGSSFGDGTGKDYATVAYDSATGDQTWVSRYNGDGDGRDVAYAVAAGADGALVFVTGDSYRGGPDDYGDSLTVAYNATDGREVWTARAYDPLGLPESGYFALDRSVDLVVHPDSSRVFATGLSWRQADFSGYNWQTLAYGTVTPPSVSVPPNLLDPPLPDYPLPALPEVPT